MHLYGYMRCLGKSHQVYFSMVDLIFSIDVKQGLVVSGAGISTRSMLGKKKKKISRRPENRF